MSLSKLDELINIILSTAERIQKCLEKANDKSNKTIPFWNNIIDTFIKLANQMRRIKPDIINLNSYSENLQEIINHFKEINTNVDNIDQFLDRVKEIFIIFDKFIEAERKIIEDEKKRGNLPPPPSVPVEIKTDEIKSNKFKTVAKIAGKLTTGQNKAKLNVEEAAAKIKAEEEAAAKLKAESDAAAKLKAESDAAAKLKAKEDADTAAAAAAKLKADEEAAAKKEAEKKAAAKLKAAAEKKAEEKRMAEEEAAKLKEEKDAKDAENERRKRDKKKREQEEEMRKRVADKMKDDLERAKRIDEELKKAEAEKIRKEEEDAKSVFKFGNTNTEAKKGPRSFADETESTKKRNADKYDKNMGRFDSKYDAPKLASNKNTKKKSLTDPNRVYADTESSKKKRENEQSLSKSKSAATLPEGSRLTVPTNNSLNRSGSQGKLKGNGRGTIDTYKKPFSGKGGSRKRHRKTRKR